MERTLVLCLVASNMALSTGLPHVVRREDMTSTQPPSSPSLGELLASYWFILVVIVLFVVIAAVFLCACVFRFKQKSSQSINLTRSSPEGSHMPPDSLPMQHLAPEGSPLGLATPIPSPQPSAGSSHRSYKRRRNGSGHVSSSSEETIRGPEYHSTVSLMSHSSGGGRPSRTESVSSGEIRLKAHKRTTSNPQIKVVHGEGVRSSMQSLDSARSSRSNSQRTLVDVDVTVHLGSDNDHETRKGIAAALAESARQLAQSAANFDQEDTYSVHSRRSASQLSRRSSLQSRRKLFPNHTSQISLGTERGYSPGIDRPPIASLDRPPTASLDRPHIPSIPTASLDRVPTVSLDRPRTIDRVTTSRRNSLTRAPPPESPLTITHSRRSLESPTNKLPPHMRLRRLHSLDDPLSQREISLDNLHHSPSPPHLFTTKPILEDVHLHYSPDVVRTQYVGLEPVSPDSGMGNGTESGSSTLRSGRRDRLSRLSEKSIEYLNAESVPEHRKAKVDSESWLRRSSRNEQTNDRPTATDSSSSASLDSTGYAPTGSGSSVESNPHDNHMIPQFSYPLERLLSPPPLYYDIDCDELPDLGNNRAPNGYTRTKASSRHS